MPAGQVCTGFLIVMPMTAVGSAPCVLARHAAPTSCASNRIRKSGPLLGFLVDGDDPDLGANRERADRADITVGGGNKCSDDRHHGSPVGVLGFRVF